ncbi:OLC1v1018198C1 [Oldenlandia corymbosa var. corymbosa]|uniref:OLC1v1018198C1 n=1 Tax=Oldenlandia corymbosa var. corymbosa TaxID=529605 RepID=A0AAV1EB42_OLDCO|nr:OLC1v1018198C1 [Oldenlandia corymbosa var. corymbosa]
MMPSLDEEGEKYDTCFDYMVGSCGDLFLVRPKTLGELTDRIKSIYVYKLEKKFDKTNLLWTEVEHIDDRVFFVNDHTSISCSPAVSTLKGNCIYFTFDRKDPNLYTYDMEEDHIHSFKPCPSAVNKRGSAYFVMFGYFLSSPKPRKKGDCN